MLFTVITINLNNADGLRSTIESVLAQERSLFEYIVIDGASTDGSIDVAKSYGDKIDCLISEPDKGIYNAMNKGIALAKGEYVIFMNSGDKFASSDVLHEVSQSNMDADVIIGATKQKKRIGYLVEKPARITAYSLLYRFYGHQSTFTKTEVLRELGGYDEDLKIAADVCFLLKALIKYNKTPKTIDLCVSDYAKGGVSETSFRAGRLEFYGYFKKNFPNIYQDYVWAHKWLRFLPSNVLRVIKLRLASFL